ncbi:MAG: aspartate kinase [Euryarchaeota archaeon]|nr:aspartate kinase [Euryarchaeota archaeon]
MRIVMKFGGTSVGDGIRILNAAKLVTQAVEKGSEVVVVASAMSKVTDQLLEIAKKMLTAKERLQLVRKFIDQLKDRHEKAVFDAIKNESIKQIILNEQNQLLQELERALIGIAYLRELTPRSLDYVTSFGERLSVPILAGAIQDLGVKAKALTGFEAGIITNSNFGKAVPIMSKTKEKVKASLESLFKQKVLPVVTGFIGADEQGNTTTLGRGGSDYSAAIIGACLGVDEILIWTDVDGVMTCDPKVVPEAKTIPVMSYIEAMELAYFGAKVIYPKTIEPAMEAKIPVRVKNTFNPTHEGTLIVHELAKTDSVVKAISLIENAALINIAGISMIGTPTIAARVFETLAREDINVIMVSQGSSEANISFAVEGTQVEQAVKALSKELALGGNFVRGINYDKNVAVIAVVGAGMRGTPGVAAKVFSAVAKKGVNILMIAQGSSEVNISFVTTKEQSRLAAEALHKEFQLER